MTAPACESESILFAPDAWTSPASDSASGLPRDLALETARDLDSKIMIVDDDPTNVAFVRRYLASAGYHKFVEISDAVRVIESVLRESPDAIVLDLCMPEMSGLEILDHLRNRLQLRYLPVLILTAREDQETKDEALSLGATDYLNKPVQTAELILRMRNALALKSYYDYLTSQTQELEHQIRLRTAELEASRLELIHCLARAAEFKDNETGRHVLRVGRYAGIIARRLGLDAPAVELIELAAPLHDLGKIGIPDAVLLKKGALSPEEVELMQKHTSYGKRTFETLSWDEYKILRRHTLLGEKILDRIKSPLLALASQIALTHHERWDGTGYPLGLSGTDIPLAGRITAVADVFDALSNRRPYKPAFPFDECLRIMEEGRATRFDPTILDAFLAGRDEVLRVRLEFADID